MGSPCRVFAGHESESATEIAQTSTPPTNEGDASIARIKTERFHQHSKRANNRYHYIVSKLSTEISVSNDHPKRKRELTILIDKANPNLPDVNRTVPDFLVQKCYFFGECPAALNQLGDRCKRRCEQTFLASATENKKIPWKGIIMLHIFRD